MKNRTLFATCALVLLLLVARPCFPQYRVDVHANVTLYGQQACTWCGAASAQMLMNGYPNIMDRLFFTQQYIWNTIQANISSNPTDVAQKWATDPLGMQQTLIALNPPPGGTWSIFSNTSRDTVLFDILFWMNTNSYPVTTLINQGGHWVVIVGYTTDIAPTRGSNPVLQDISIYDPEPHNIGSYSTKTAAVWYSTDWSGSVSCAGTWNNHYVAVVEPPASNGAVKVKLVERTGENIIRSDQALESAKRWIGQLSIFKRHPYEIFHKKELRNLTPILVREEIRFGLENEKRVPEYYLVPFGFARETGECGAGLARASIIVNAFSGDFEEVGVFGQAVPYLPELEAIRVVGRAMQLEEEELKDARATMMFRPSDPTHIRIYPFWKVTFKDHVMYVDQLGKLYRNLLPAVPGD